MLPLTRARNAQPKDEDEEFDDPARSGHPLQRCLNVVEDLLNMPESEPFSKPVSPLIWVFDTSAALSCSTRSGYSI